MRKPDFFIVGAPRCGTTAMNEYLKANPEIYIPNRKEIHYFDTDQIHAITRTQAEYLSLFESADKDACAGEASVWYLYSQAAADNIKAFNPEAKIIIMLRNPVVMLHSLHARLLFHGNEDIESFAHAFALSADRLAGRLLPPNCSISPHCLAYEEVGKYCQHVQRYIDAFGHDRVHVVIYDDLRANTAGEYQRVLEFLGLDPTFKTNFKVINPNVNVRYHWLQGISDGKNPLTRKLVSEGGKVSKLIWKLNRKPSKRKTLDPASLERMSQIFAPDIQALSEILGRDLKRLWLNGHGSAAA